MSDRFAICLPITLAHEGGYVDHPRDPGGATNLGVTIGTLSRWLGRPATKAEVKALTLTDVAPIYRKNYWQATGSVGYQPGADLCVFDAAVNSGPARAIKWAKAVKAVGAPEFIASYCDLRLSFLKRLGIWGSFGKGWSRRVADIRAKATAMALAAIGAPSPIARTVLEAEAARAEGRARKDIAVAATGGTTSAGAGVAAPAAGIEATTSWGVIALTAVVTLSAVAFLIIRSRNRRDEAAAFRQEAAHV